MSFMDKVKAQAEQAVAKGQQAVAQGQTKFDTLQAKKNSDALLRDLGAAYYAAQRSGGPNAAVEQAMAALDAHAASAGPVDTSATPPSQPTEGGGSFNLDDV